MIATQRNNFPKLHNAAWPGVVGKGDGGEPPIDIDTMLDLTAAADDTVDSYSHGMQQKASLAAALMHDPKVLVLDEPTVGLLRGRYLPVPRREGAMWAIADL